VLFIAAMLWIRRGGIGGPILVGALCVFELQSFPTWHRHSAGDWISQIAFVVVAAAGLLVTLAVLRQSYRIRKAKAGAARIAALLSLLVLVSAGAALADSGGVGTVSITEHFPGLVLVPPTASPNPCTGAPGTFSVIATNAVGHFTVNANGFWDTFTAEGAATFVPADSSQPTLTGRVTTWDGESGNLNNYEATNILVTRIGTVLMKDVGHVTYFPATNTVSVAFDKPTLSCVG
jgi:hypothetical protein